MDINMHYTAYSRRVRLHHLFEQYITHTKIYWHKLFSYIIKLLQQN